MRKVIGELMRGYEGGAVAIDDAEGVLDGVGLGEWMHGGDVREALGEPHAYTSPGVSIAVPLLIERSRRQAAATIEVTLESDHFVFGPERATVGALHTDVETFVRLCGGRRPDAARFELTGATPQDLVLFS